MQINVHEQFSSSQALASGDTWSQPVDLGPPLSMPGMQRPFVRVQAPAPLRAVGAATLRIFITHSDDGERFTSCGVLLDEIDAAQAKGVLVVARMPAHAKRFVRLAYRVHGQLTGGAVSAFLTEEGPAEGTTPARRGTAPSRPEVYYPSGIASSLNQRN